MSPLVYHEALRIRVFLAYLNTRKASSGAGLTLSLKKTLPENI